MIKMHVRCNNRWQTGGRLGLGLGDGVGWGGGGGNIRQYKSAVIVDVK